MRTLRLIWMGWLFQFKQLRRSSFDSFLAVLWPLFFATVAFFMFRQGGDPDSLIYASLGAAVMGIWSATSLAAGTALQRERWLGTLELLVAAPAHFALVILPVGLATSTIGVYCMATTLVWSGSSSASTSRSSIRCSCASRSLPPSCRSAPSAS